MLLETFKTAKLRYLLTLFSLLCLLVLPYDAYAAEQGYGSFWYGPNEQTTEGVKYIKVGVVASNKYDAALYALGFGKSTVTGISNSKKNKLIANSTFSSFASGFKTGKPDDDLTATLPGVPTIGLNTDSMLSAWYAASAMYGNGNCYWSIYSKDSSTSAYDAAYRIIKSGSSTGGGGSSSGGSVGQDNNYVYIDMEHNPWPNQPENVYSGVAIELSAYQHYLDVLNANSDMSLWITTGQNSQRFYTICILSKKPIQNIVKKVI